jgi:hypothetical protein
MKILQIFSALQNMDTTLFQEGRPAACKVVVLFTDGRFVIGPVVQKLLLRRFPKKLKNSNLDSPPSPVRTQSRWQRNCAAAAQRLVFFFFFFNI